LVINGYLHPWAFFYPDGVCAENSGYLSYSKYSEKNIHTTEIKTLGQAKINKIRHLLTRLKNNSNIFLPVSVLF
jgi:hypothetical protein